MANDQIEGISDLDTENHPLGSLTSFTELLKPFAKRDDSGGELPSSAGLPFEAEFASQTIKLAEQVTGTLTVGLIDGYQFSRECLVAALISLNPHLVIHPFKSIEDYIANNNPTIELLIYYPHGGDPMEETILQDVGMIRHALPDIPIVVLSDTEAAQQPKSIRTTLNSGAHGFIPTRTTGIPIAIAAISFVKAGGTFAPLDQLLTNQTQCPPTPPDTESQVLLTSRQMAVLSHLQQGKANKIIAFELNMSESTVKVHVRNIMRKIGASNRTQAAYKARQLLNRFDLNKIPSL